jgi:hypothetical protein
VGGRRRLEFAYFCAARHDSCTSSSRMCLQLLVGRRWDGVYVCEVSVASERTSLNFLCQSNS